MILYQTFKIIFIFDFCRGGVFVCVCVCVCVCVYVGMCLFNLAVLIYSWVDFFGHIFIGGGPMFNELDLNRENNVTKIDLVLAPVEVLV